MAESRPVPESIHDRAGVDALLAAATNYEERLPRDPLRQALDLGRVEALFESVGNPHRGPRTVHVAGSKGKGTVARMIASGLVHAGRGPVGLYTSPHLEDLAERIAIDGEPVAEGVLARAADALLPHVRRTHGTPEAPTFFELFTAVAWLAFREAGCTDVVLETGLGGRLDATNVCAPAVTVITAIELEHTRLLGESIEEIAAEKAGIIKTDVPVVALGLDRAAHRVVVARAAEVGAVVESEGVDRVPGWLALPGDHHRTNAHRAFQALRLLGISAEEAWRGIDAAQLPGILEPVGGHPLVLIDGAHTVGSARGTRAAVEARRPGERVVLLIAMLDDKDVEGVAAALARGVGRIVATQVGSPRCIPAGALAARIEGVVEASVDVQPDLQLALGRARALAGNEGVVLCSGSIYLAGAVRALAGVNASRPGTRGS